MSGLALVAGIWLLAGLGWAIVRAFERRSALPRRQFRRAMRSLAASASVTADRPAAALRGAGSGVGGGSGLGLGLPPLTSLTRPNQPSITVLRHRRQVVTWCTSGLAALALAVTAIAQTRAVAGVAAAATVLAVGYQVVLESVRRAHR